MIQRMPTSSTQPLAAFDPMPLAPTSRNTYWPATWARLAMTRMSAATMPQPPAQPRLGANRRGAPRKRVPTVGARFFQLAVPDRGQEDGHEGEDGDDGGV